MLGGGQRAVVLDSFYERRNKLRHALRIFPKRPRINDGICGIVVHVRIRRVHPVDAGGAGLKRGDLSHGIGIFGIAASRHGHCGGEGCALIVAHRRATLEIRPDEQRQLGLCLQLIGEHRRRIRLALYDAQWRTMRDDNESADMQVLNIVQKLLVGRRVSGGKASVIRGEQQLADLFAQRHFAQRGLHPRARRWREILCAPFAACYGLLCGSLFPGRIVTLTACFLGHKDEQ